MGRARALPASRQLGQVDQPARGDFGLSVHRTRVTSPAGITTALSSAQMDTGLPPWVTSIVRDLGATGSSRVPLVCPSTARVNTALRPSRTGSVPLSQSGVSSQSGVPYVSIQRSVWVRPATSTSTSTDVYSAS